MLAVTFFASNADDLCHAGLDPAFSFTPDTRARFPADGLISGGIIAPAIHSKRGWHARPRPVSPKASVQPGSHHSRCTAA